MATRTVKNTLSANLSRAVVRDWIRYDLWPDVYEETRVNFHGRMFNRVSGETWRDVKARSGPTERGLRLSTTKPGAIAWMKGSDRRGYWVAPVKAKLLSWVGSDGVRRFSRGHMIPPWKFAPKRPAFEDAIERAGGKNLKTMQRRLGKELRLTFRGGKLTINVPFQGDRGAPTFRFKAKG